MGGPRTSFGRRPALDGVRALAVLAVVAFHSGLLRGGWIGVDLFFCLSGYLITGLLVAEANAMGRVSLTAFWGRRARRLLPAAALMLLLVVLLGGVATQGWSPPTPAEVWGVLTYSANWVQLSATRGYFQQYLGPSPVEHAWSLAVEEQFYVVWPLVFIAAWRWRARGVLVAACAVAITSAALQVALASSSVRTDRIYLGSDTRAVAFALGAVLVVSLDRRRLAERMAVRLVPATLVALVVAAVVLDGADRWIYRGPLLAVSACGALLVWSTANLPTASFVARALSVSPLRAIGKWSYGIYLFHWPIAVAIGLRRFAPWPTFALVTALSVAAAAISYETVERRLLPGVPRRAVPALGALGVVIACVALAAAASEPPSLTASERAALFAPPPSVVLSTTSTVDAGDTTSSTSSTSTLPPLEGVAVEADPSNALVVSERPRLLLLGDSVPFQLADDWLRWAEVRSFDVLVRAAVGCRPSALTVDQTRGDTSDVCASMIGNLPRDISLFRPHALVFHYGMAEAVVRWQGTKLDACAVDGTAALTTQLNAVLDMATSVGAITFVVMPNDPPDGLGLDPRNDRARGAACFRAVYEAVAAVRPSEVRLLRVDRLVCPQGETGCDGRWNGVQLRTDGIHFSDAGATVVVPWIEERVFRSPAGDVPGNAG